MISHDSTNYLDFGVGRCPSISSELYLVLTLVTRLRRIITMNGDGKRGREFISCTEDLDRSSRISPPKIPDGSSCRRMHNDNSVQSLGMSKTLVTRKAKRVKFYRNGDKFYSGIVIPVTAERYRSFDSLINDLTRILIPNVTLPNGVRFIHTMNGRKIQDMNDLEDGESYVVSGHGEIFRNIDYPSIDSKRHLFMIRSPSTPSLSVKQMTHPSPRFRAKIITLIRSGTKPRKIVRLLLNKRNSSNLDHVLEAITQVVKLDTGAVRKVYSLSGQQITLVEEFYKKGDIFIVYGLEKTSPHDFELDSEEERYIQGTRRNVFDQKKYEGPMPRMPSRRDHTCSALINSMTQHSSAVDMPTGLNHSYSIGKVIGDGNFAIVRECMHKSTKNWFALKIIDRNKCRGKEDMLAREVAILRQVNHPNIISLIEVLETDGYLFLIMELMKGGDLFDAIASVTKFSETDASIMLSHLCYALAYLHSRNIVHRDIKPENLLVQMSGRHVVCLKLADFGLAQIVEAPLYTICGTPTYVAPEILAEVGYGVKIDVWAAGVILYILLCGFPPFVSNDDEQEKLFERILSGHYEFISPFWDNVSSSAKEIITNMLQIQPDLRFTAEDVLDHPWILMAKSHGVEQTDLQDE